MLILCDYVRGYVRVSFTFQLQLQLQLHRPRPGPGLKWLQDKHKLSWRAWQYLKNSLKY